MANLTNVDFEQEAKKKAEEFSKKKSKKTKKKSGRELMNEKDCRAKLIMEPHNIETLMRLSDILHEKGDFQECIKHLKIAKEHQMNDVHLEKIYDKMAEHYFVTKHWHNALKYF